MHPDGTHVKKLTDDSLNAARADWSPDGDTLAFVNNLCAICDLSDVFTMRPNGKGISQITHDAGNYHYPSWSPDGRSLVVENSGDGFTPPDLYVIGREGSEATNITNNPAIDFEPDWGPGDE